MSLRKNLLASGAVIALALTKIGNLGLLCKFHHLVAIHDWGWTLKLQPGGIWEAISPDQQTIYRTHDLPTRQAA